MPSAAEYGLAWLAAIGATEPVDPATVAELRSAERLRLLPAPLGIPTLVVTGGWNEEYEEIASALAQLGATHRRLTGFGHRVQDHREADSLIRDWAGRN